MIKDTYDHGKILGATLAGERKVLDRYYEQITVTGGDAGVRFFARGVIMGAAQTIDPTINHLSAAVKVLGLNRPAPLTGGELVLAVSRAVDSVRDNIGEPVWTPLEAVLPFDWCGAFMYMGAHVDADIVCGSPDRRRNKTVFQYKHGITRRYLFVGDDLQAYTYEGGEIGSPRYSWVPMDAAIERAFEDVELLGAERSTKYDAAFIAERNARLVAAGYTVVG